MTKISNTSIAILATDGFEKSELFEPKKQLEQAGATITIVSLEAGSIKSWDQSDWGESISVDKLIGEVAPAQFDALVLPGGQINPDLLRVNADAVRFVREFHETGKPLAAICHAPWLLIEAGISSGRKLASYPSIATDVKNSGAEWKDQAVVIDDNLITSRNPDDLNEFCAAIIDAVAQSAAQSGAREKDAA